jgi:hypothetical protein
MTNKTAKNLKFNIVSSITRLYLKSDLEINENVAISKKLANDTKYIIGKNSPKIITKKISPNKDRKSANKKKISPKKGQKKR